MEPILLLQDGRLFHETAKSYSSTACSNTGCNNTRWQLLALIWTNTMPQFSSFSPPFLILLRLRTALFISDLPVSTFRDLFKFDVLN